MNKKFLYGLKKWLIYKLGGVLPTHNLTINSDKYQKVRVSARYEFLENNFSIEEAKSNIPNLLAKRLSDDGLIEFDTFMDWNTGGQIVTGYIDILKHESGV